MIREAEFECVWERTREDSHIFYAKKRNSVSSNMIKCKEPYILLNTWSGYVIYWWSVKAWNSIPTFEAMRFSERHTYGVCLLESEREREDRWLRQWNPRTKLWGSGERKETKCKYRLWLVSEKWWQNLLAGPAKQKQWERSSELF